MTVTNVLLFVAVFAAGIAAGGMTLTLLGVLPIRNRMAAAGFVEFHQLSSPLIDRVVPVGIVASLLAALAAAVFGDLEPAARIALAVGAAASLGVIAISLTINFPINRTVEGWSLDAVPADWTAAFDRWQRAHAIRTPLALVALACYSVGALAG